MKTSPSYHLSVNKENFGSIVQWSFTSFCKEANRRTIDSFGGSPDTPGEEASVNRIDESFKPGISKIREVAGVELGYSVAS